MRRRSRHTGARQRLLALVVIVIVAIVVPPPLIGASAAVRTTTELPFALVERSQRTARLHELTFASPAADGGTATVRLLLPDDYDPSGATRYPVLYLLHGGGGGEAGWTDRGDAEAATTGLPLIVVMPGVTGHGNYVDWYNHGAGGPPMWETFVIGQLLPWVDANLPTVGERSGRAVGGLSMGGGGAMGYAARHPDLFVSAAAFSGAVDTNVVAAQLLASIAGLGHGHAFSAVNGYRLTEEVRWRNNNPWDIAANLRDVDVFLTTGDGRPGGIAGDWRIDPIEAACHRMMGNLHARLTGLGIAHHWDDYGPGSHSWPYWQRSLHQYLPHLMAVFAEHRRPPTVVDFTTADSAYSVHGWDVVFDRPAMEFSALDDAGVAGFHLSGTGLATVRTPPIHEPGGSFDIEVSGPAGEVRTTVVADSSGRLRVDVDLGPGNPYQQHTVAARLWALTLPGGRWPVRTATVVVTPATRGEQPVVTSGASAPTG